MAVASTLRQVYVELCERYGLATVLREIDPDSVAGSTITLADSYLQRPVSSKAIPINAPILFTSPADSGTATSSTTTTITDSTKAWVASEWIGFIVRMGGWSAVVTANTTTALTVAALDVAPTIGAYNIEYGMSRVSDYNPNTGVITMKPTLGTPNAAQVQPHTAILFDKAIDHPDRMKDAINRALQNKIGRWEPRPLTFVPDGDLQGAIVTDYWTAAANGVAAYGAAQVFPAGSAADAVGQVGLSRLVQLTTSGGASSISGNGIRGQTSTALRSWYFLTAIRLVSGAGTATFSVRDNTNSADITLQVTRGNDTNTLTTATFGDFMVCEGTFQQPATCSEVAPRLSLSATGQVAQMGPVIMFPQDAVSFPLSNRVESSEFIGNFFGGYTLVGPGGLPSIAYGDPLTNGGLEHRIYDYGDHLSVTFNFSQFRPVFYEEWVNGSAMNAMTDTTTFPLDRLVMLAYADLTDRLMREELMRGAKLDNGTPSPSTWRPIRNAAVKAARHTAYTEQPKKIVGRR